MQGKVTVDGTVKMKPGTYVDVSACIECTFEVPRYVSRGGFKLERALDHFGVDVADKIVLDAGLSTGGFTDCLLQRGAARVYGIDVGYGQVHEKIRADPRVIVRERTNLREVTSVGELVDLVTLDLAFISVLKVMENVCALLKQDGALLVLIKPQFEARRQDVGRGGIVNDPEVHAAVIKSVTEGIERYGFVRQGVIESPIQGGDGNREFLGYFKRNEQ